MTGLTALQTVRRGLARVVVPEQGAEEETRHAVLLTEGAAGAPANQSVAVDLKGAAVAFGEPTEDHLCQVRSHLDTHALREHHQRRNAGSASARASRAAIAPYTLWSAKGAIWKPG